MKKSLIQFIITFILLLIAIAAYGVWFVVVDTENAKARDLASQIQNKSQEVTRIAAAKAALASLSANEAVIASHFVSAGDVVTFLGGLESTGSALGSDVQVISVAADKPKPGQQGHLTVALQITGSFNAVMRTLGAFEYAPYDVKLTNLTFGSEDTVATSTANKWSASASFSVGTGPAATSTTPAK